MLCKNVVIASHEFGGFAMNYSYQNERNHRALLKAVNAGKIDEYHEK
jgi:hypothetical protein